MAAPMKKTTPRRARAAGGIDCDRQFPVEAYSFDNDVTPEAVEKMRELAKPIIEAEEWEVVDGFGFTDAR